MKPEFSVSLQVEIGCIGARKEAFLDDIQGVLEFRTISYLVDHLYDRVW